MNKEDNCKSIPNKDQADMDGDGYGDVCDNCKEEANPQQIDDNQNLIGDVCEKGLESKDRVLTLFSIRQGDDTDGDGFVGKGDNCPKVFNSNQLDTDNDGKNQNTIVL